MAELHGDKRHEDDGHGNALGSVYVLRCAGSNEYHDYVTAESYEAMKRRAEHAYPYPEAEDWTVEELADAYTARLKDIDEYRQWVGRLQTTPSHVAPSGDELVMRLRQEIDLMRSPVVNENVRKIMDIASGLMEQAADRLASAPSTTPRSGDVYLCRASGEGSQDFRVCADEAAVFAFYEEMTGRDQDGTLDSITKSFGDSDYWGSEGRAFHLDLYMAKFEVWKVEAREISFTPSATRDRRPWNQQDADMLAAAVDDAIRRGGLDARSQIADCRLDYGRPFSPEEVAEHLAKRRHGKNASLRAADGGKQTDG